MMQKERASVSDAAALARLGPLAAHHAVSVGQVGPRTRFGYRGAESTLAGLGAAFGVTPLTDICRAASEGDHAALWLGPDEWLLLAPDGEVAALTGKLEAALAGVPHSLVDISHRNAAFEVTGEHGPAVLNVGCPLDFHAFPVGMCTRTVLGKAEVVLWRRSPQRFHLEVWRSFAPYVQRFLGQAVEDEVG
jgi:sarcosine oxidase subunit gamma